MTGRSRMEKDLPVFYNENMSIRKKEYSIPVNNAIFTPLNFFHKNVKHFQTQI